MNIDPPYWAHCWFNKPQKPNTTSTLNISSVLEPPDPLVHIITYEDNGGYYPSHYKTLCGANGVTRIEVTRSESKGCPKCRSILYKLYQEMTE